jgi:hypothetical protein
VLTLCRDTLRRHERLHQADNEQDDQGRHVSGNAATASDTGHVSSRNVDPILTAGPTTSILSIGSQQSEQSQCYIQPGLVPTTAQNAFANVPAATGSTQPTLTLGLPDLAANNNTPWDWIDSAGYELPDSFQFDFLDLPLDLNQPSQTPVFDGVRVENVSALSQHTSRAATESIPVGNESAAVDRQSKWFSFVESPVPYNDFSNDASHVPEGDGDLDESYRRIVQRQLDVWEVPSLPPIAFLNECLRQVTQRFSCLLPIIHLPTFKPTDSNALLLVSMCAIGSQLVNSSEAQLHGDRMFESLHRAVLASWSSLSTTRRDVLPIFQAVVMGQTFAMLSAKRSHLLTAQAFHGTIIFSYQQARKNMERLYAAEGETSSALSKIGLLDKFRQDMDRVGYALCIQDTELSLLCNQPPVLRGRDGMMSEPRTDDEYFIPDLQPPPLIHTAKDPDYSWNTRDTSSTLAYTNRSAREDCDHAEQPLLWQYANLSNLLAEIAEQRCRPKHAESQQQQRHYEVAIAEWLSNWKDQLKSPQARVLQLDCLWHSGWLAILCDLDLLEIANGRDGSGSAEKAVFTTIMWASSPEAHRALIHVFGIQRSLASITLAQTPAIHIPRCAYHAALVLCSLAAFAPADHSAFSVVDEDLRRSVDIQAMVQAGWLSTRSWSKIEAEYKTRERVKEQAAGLASTLERLGGWGLSKNLARTLRAVMN